MTDNKGKKFEEKLKENWVATVPNSSIDRIYDTVNGLKGVTNVCDFIGYKKPNIFYIEAKSHKKNTFPFSCLSQYDKLKDKVGIPGVRAGVVIWFIDHDRIVYVPISTITKMMSNGDKSVNIRTIDKYNYYEIPAEKKRIYLDGDYSVLLNTKEGE